MMMITQKRFSLSLDPSLINNLFNTHFRSLIMYGSQLLTTEERTPLDNIDDELTRMLLKGFLKLKSTTLATKHKNRLHLLLGIPTLDMEVEQRCLARINLVPT